MNKTIFAAYFSLCTILVPINVLSFDLCMHSGKSIKLASYSCVWQCVFDIFIFGTWKPSNVRLTNWCGSVFHFVILFFCRYIRPCGVVCYIFIFSYLLRWVPSTFLPWSSSPLAPPQRDSLAAPPLEPVPPLPVWPPPLPMPGWEGIVGWEGEPASSELEGNWHEHNSALLIHSQLQHTPSAPWQSGRIPLESEPAWDIRSARYCWCRR